MLRTGNFCKKITSNLLFCLGKIQLESIIVLLCVNFNYPRVKIETIDIYPRGQVPGVILHNSEIFNSKEKYFKNITAKCKIFL